MKSVKLGKAAGTESYLRIDGDAENMSILITGKSGTGKTTALRKISRNIADDGGSVLMLSFRGTQAMMAHGGNVRKISAYKEGIPLTMLAPVSHPDGSREDVDDVIESVVNIFADVARLQSRQKMALREAVGRAVRSRDSRANEVGAIGRELCRDRENEAAIAVYERFHGVFKKAVVSAGKPFLESGKITVLDLDGFSPDTQKFLAELVLAILWRYFIVWGQHAGRTLYIVCDEFHNLSLRSNSILSQILREGRKFNIAMLLATQTMDGFTKSERAVLNQAATRLYFRQACSEARSIAKRLMAGRADELEGMLKNLQRGECVAYGRLRVGSSALERPVRMTFRE